MSKEIILTLADEDLERLNQWVPCTRIRLVNTDGETKRLEIDKRAVCRTCQGAGTWTDAEKIKWRCKPCRGTGLL